MNVEAFPKKRTDALFIFFFSFSSFNQCGCLSLPIVCFYISGGASAERRPAEIPFSLISGDRAPGTPREPSQLAGLFFGW